MGEFDSGDGQTDDCVAGTNGSGKTPVGHQEDSTGHQNGAGHEHGSTGYEHGIGHQKFHCDDDGGDDDQADCDLASTPVGHQEDSTGHQNGVGHHHDSTGYANGQGHAKFHCDDDGGDDDDDVSCLFNQPPLCEEPGSYPDDDCDDSGLDFFLL